MNELTARRLGDRIALIRQQLGLSLGELSEATGVAKSYLSRLERGESLNVGLATLSAVASALGVTVHDLLPRPSASDEGTTSASADVSFEMITDSMPEALQQFLNEEEGRGEPVPEDAKRALAVLKLRGKRPESAGDYRLLYHLLRRMT